MQARIIYDFGEVNIELFKVVSFGNLIGFQS